MEDEVRSQSMLDLARAVWARRKWLAVLAFIGPLALVLSVLAFMPKLYEANATILVERDSSSSRASGFRAICRSSAGPTRSNFSGRQRPP